MKPNLGHKNFICGMSKLQANRKVVCIGGAFLISPSVDEGAMAAYRSATKIEDASGSKVFNAESVTGYEGFVRMAARRGFHLMLVREVGDSFEPMLQ